MENTIVAHDFQNDLKEEKNLNFFFPNKIKEKQNFLKDNNLNAQSF